MALPATAVIEIRNATGSFNNGGGFNSARGGTDYSQQTSPQETRADGTGAGTTNFASALGTFTSVMVGNYIHIPTTGTGLTVGWYEITAFVDAHNVTLDSSPGTGVSTYYLGGALALGGASDDAVFEIAIAGNIFYMSGNVTLGAAVSVAAAGTGPLPVQFIGYTSSRTDNPTNGAQPTMACGTNAFVPAADWSWKNVGWSGVGSSTALVTCSTNRNRFANCLFKNVNTTANRAAINITGADTKLIACELYAYRGRAVALAGTRFNIMGCYIHDSDIGILATLSTSGSITENLFVSNITNAISIAATVIQQAVLIDGNTFYGSENKGHSGTGVAMATGANQVALTNNIFYGFTTNAISHADATAVIYNDYNDANNNGTNYSNITAGPHSVTTAPGFVNAGQTVVTTATTSNTGNTLVKAGATFLADGVTAGRDFVYIYAGATTGVYGIVSVDSETQITLDSAPGNQSGTVSAEITRGRNFAIGTALKALGFPGAFMGAYTTGYRDIGAVQRQESATSGGAPALIMGST